MNSSLKTIARLAGFGALALLSACATQLAEPVSGYSCCNLRSYAGWVSSHNVQGGTLIPAGEPVRLTSIKKRFYVYGTVGTDDLAFRDDSASTQADTLLWVKSLVVAEDPREQLKTWPFPVRMAAQSGRVMVGMTRAQVLFSLGHPSREDTPDLNAPAWRYWAARDDTPVDLNFGADDKLASFSGTPAAVREIAVEP